MSEFYFDMETTGTDSAKDKIITIQFHDLSAKNYADAMPTILREWESSEKEILARFFASFRFFERDWDFVPVGFNLEFELRFLFARAKLHGFIPADARYEEMAARKPRLDLKPVAVLMNGGSFKGATLDAFSAKPATGKEVPDLYNEKDYSAILDYIQKEMWGFLRLYARLASDLPRYWRDTLGPEMREQRKLLASVKPSRAVPVQGPPPKAALRRHE